MSNPGNAGKQSGMARAQRHSNPAWWLEAEAAVVKVARVKQKFTTDDVLLLVSPTVSTHEMRALGPVMREAAKGGVIEKALELPVNCATRPSNHSRPLTVWKSLIFKGATTTT